MEYRPILDRILCKDASELIRFDRMGNHIPDELQKKTLEAEVIAVGDGVYLGGIVLPMPVQVGDIVKYSEYSAQEINLDGVEYLLIRVPDVKAVKSPKRLVN